MPAPSTPISVVICSCDPRIDYLQRTLEGLRLQTLSVDQWELLVVDNASAIPIASRIDLSWHPRARCVEESTPGLTRARLRGIGETSSPLIIFVDDDNVLAPDYLASALEIDRTHSFLGAWGGSVRGIFEIPPPNFCLRYAHMLAIREVERDSWSNTIENFDSSPCGAGQCVRRAVAEAWMAEVQTAPTSLQLGRIGGQLGACEDGHLALSSVKLGLGTGIFRRLSLDHLIPKQRLTIEYFTRLAAGHAYSYNLMRNLLGLPPLLNAQSLGQRLLMLYRQWRSTFPEDRAIEAAMAQARARSLRDLAASQSSSDSNLRP